MKFIDNDDLLRKHLNSASVRRYFPAQLDRHFQLASLRQNEQIIRQGEKSAYLYYLLSGRCKVSAVMENGRTVIINSLEAPCLIGEIELINRDVPFSVESITEVLLLALPVDKARDSLLNSPDFLYQLCSDLVDKERTHAIRLAHYVSFPLINRLAQFILTNSTPEGMQIKKTVIAESLGVSYRHLEKVMNDLVSQGTLEKQKRNYRIIKAEYLRSLAQQMEVF
ncbi:MAG: transcriptional regulator YeiL [Erysipelotrichaceae bacterium]|nr:transcriptional regulator YeiL [Erysipelotrichaceae bacterium]